jgi:Fe-S cluster biogenesis protein NfuA
MSQPPAVQIRTQRTPNPNAWKYVLDRDVKRAGKISYTERAACEHVPLAVALLDLPNVTQVHFFENVITVTQNGASDWTALDPAIQDRIQSYAPLHDPDFAESTAPKEKTVDRATLPKELQDIEAILDRTVRPSLQADGGDVEVVELDGNILSVRYQGACGGCPSSMYGTLQAIESILRDEFNPYLEVVAL